MHYYHLFFENLFLRLFSLQFAVVNWHRQSTYSITICRYVFGTSDAHQTGIRNVLLNKKFPENKLLTQFYPSNRVFVGCVSPKTIFTYTARFTRSYCAMLSIVYTHTHMHMYAHSVLFFFMFSVGFLYLVYYLVSSAIVRTIRKFFCLTSDILFKYKLFACTGTEQSDVRETFQSVKSSNVLWTESFFLSLFTCKSFVWLIDYWLLTMQEFCQHQNTMCNYVRVYAVKLDNVNTCD